MHSFKTHHHHHHHHPAAIKSSSTAGAVLPTARPQRPVVNRTLLSCQASRCHYDTLGVQPTASAEDIKSAFRKLALQLHPDINTAPNATEHFRTVKVAYEVLSDPQQRAAYNRQRLQAQTSYTRSSRSTSTPSGGVENVVYDYVEDIDETFEEAAAAGFWGWYQRSGSWQSSWDNRQKRKRRRQQQQTQQQAGQQSSRQQQARQQAAQQAQQRQARQRQQARHQQQHATVQQMVSQLDPATLKMVRSLFGEDLERLDSLEDLVEVLDSLELLRTQGIDLDAIMFDNDSSASSSGGGTGGISNSRGSRGGSSASQASSSRAGRSSSNTSSRARSSSTSSSTSSRRGSAARAGRRQPGRHFPRFDELSAEELYELINSQTDRKTAQAARAWVQEQLATNQMHPGVAGSLAFLLATDYVMADLEQPDPRDFVFGEMFDPDSERYRGRARAGSPGDYVKYSSNGSSSEDDGEEVEGGQIDMDELLSAFDAWEQSEWDEG